MANDLDKHCLCPECNKPMQLLMPIWITPGEEYIDTGNIDYESENPKYESNWWCNSCSESFFPIDNQ